MFLENKNFSQLGIPSCCIVTLFDHFNEHVILQYLCGILQKWQIANCDINAVMEVPCSPLYHLFQKTLNLLMSITRGNVTQNSMNFVAMFFCLDSRYEWDVQCLYKPADDKFVKRKRIVQIGFLRFSYISFF